MLRVQYERYGGPEELRLVDRPLAAPGSGQIRVRVLAASVNPVDWKILAGVLKMMTGKAFPRGMGEDYAGIVDAVGPGVTRFKVGDEVFGAMELKDAASFSEMIVTPDETATAKPKELSFEQAATLPTVGQTAWQALVVVGRLRNGQRVFINGCLGSVGRCAVQIARSLGAEVSGTCNEGGFAEAKALGVEDPMDYRRFSPKQVRGRFDVVLDTAGTLSTGQCSGMLRGKGLALHINPSFAKMLMVGLSRRNKLVFLKTSSDLLARVGTMAAEGKLTLPIGRTVPLADAIPAVVDLERTGTPKGKVVIVPA